MMDKEEQSKSNDSKQTAALKNFFMGNQKEENGIEHNGETKAKVSENENSLHLSPSSDQIKINNSSPSRASSPDPGCAICLGQLENKSFTDSCFHTFCFTCLLEWSKVKPECPLCKQPFESIVYNVRSIEDYDQYHISKSGENSWRSPDGQRFRFSTTLTAERLLERRRRAVFENSQEYVFHRSTYAPHSVSSQSSRGFIPEYHSTSIFRRRIYEGGLWVKPLGNGDTRRFRSTSPEFFRQNPACTHRLNPWLNRELLALLHDSESQVTFVLELILALIMRYDIRSQEFYVHIQPYLQNRTSHFIHEFYNYASSPCDLINYDNTAMYERLESFANNNTSVISSPGSDVVALPSPDIALPDCSPTCDPVGSFLSSCKRDNERKGKISFRSSTKLFLRRNQENDLWQTVSPSSSQLSQGSSLSIQMQIQQSRNDISRPSTSGTKTNKQSSRKSAQLEKSSPPFSDSDDCIIVDVVKAKALRTPEVVNLISSDEEMLDDSSFSHGGSLSRTSNIPEKEKSMEVESNDNDLLGKDCVKETIKYAAKKYTKSRDNYASNMPSTSKENIENSDFLDCHETVSSSTSQKPPSISSSRSHSKSTSCSRSHSREQKSTSQSPQSKSRRKEKSHKTKHHSTSYDSSTDSSLSEEDYQSRGLCINETKVKLKSVVWSFSSTEPQCSRSDHNCHGKRHKHKKKKKHGKHKRHKHSYSMNKE